MSRIPQVRTYSIKFLSNNKKIAELVTRAPTKHLAWLNLAYEHPKMLKFKFQADKITIGVVKE
jgi:hypothetical protein